MDNVETERGTSGGTELIQSSGCVICIDMSRARIATFRASLSGKSDRDTAREMQRFLGKETARYNQLVPTHWYGYELAAQWWGWFAVDSANKEESLRYAKNTQALSDDMRDRPDHYARRDSDRYTHWEWMQFSSHNPEMMDGASRSHLSNG